MMENDIAVFLFVCVLFSVLVHLAFKSVVSDMYEREAEWKKGRKCSCGAIYEAPFNSAFHIHHDVCPKCGTDKREWQYDAVTYRRIRVDGKLQYEFKDD